MGINQRMRQFPTIGLWVLFWTVSQAQQPKTEYLQSERGDAEHWTELKWTPEESAIFGGMPRLAGRLVRFVAVVHPLRGQILLLSTELALAPAEIILLYTLRFKFEVSFKQALHSVGTCAYHFWMRPMKPLRRFPVDQFLHHQSAVYRADIRRELDAYHRHIQIGLVAQGLLQCLAALHAALVWRHFGS